MGKETREYKCLGIIIEKFEVYDFDWLNYEINKGDPLTFHHIKPKREGGTTIITNGAPLTISSHTKFHVIERKNYIIAKQLTRLFRSLHELEKSADEEYYDQVRYYLDKYENKRVRVRF